MVYADIKLFLIKPIVPQVLCGIGLVFIALALGFGVLDLFSNKTEKNPHQEAFQAALNSVADKEKPSTEFLKTPLFGEYIPQNLEQGNIKRSTMRLSLVGILFSLHEADSIVTIRLRGKGEQMFRVGDQIPGGAVIKRIMPDGVLFMREGNMESLSLPKNELIFEQPPKPMGEE